MRYKCIEEILKDAEEELESGETISHVELMERLVDCARKDVSEKSELSKYDREKGPL